MSSSPIGLSRRDRNTAGAVDAPSRAWPILAPRTRQVIELPEVRPDVTEYRTHCIACPDCAHVTVGQEPADAPRGGFGDRLIAFVSLLTGRFRFTRRLVPELLDEVFGIPMCLGSVSGCEGRMSAALEAPYGTVHEAVKSAEIVHADETSWRENKAKAWLWVACLPQLTLFLVDRRRDTAAAKKLLGERCSGVTVCDRYSAYHWLKSELRQSCWSHLDRDFQAMVERGGTDAEVGTRLRRAAASVFRWHRQVREGRRAHAWLAHKCKRLRGEVLRALELRGGQGRGEDLGDVPHPAG